MQYKTDITADGPKVLDSRVIADLSLKEVSDRQWQKAIYDENVLQIRGSTTAKRKVRRPAGGSESGYRKEA